MVDIDALESAVDELLRRGVAEDVGSGDITSCALVAEGVWAKAAIVAREPGVMAGLRWWPQLFALLRGGEQVEVEQVVAEGAMFEAGAVLGRVCGPASVVLTAERLALNLLQRLCGIATLTARYVAAVAGTGVQILDTRKTTPGLRLAEKYAVHTGGGTNHRMGLFDQAMIKDNHLVALGLGHNEAVTLEAAVGRVRAHTPGCSVILEVDRLSQLEAALRARPDVLLLDNMDVPTLRGAVQWVRAHDHHAEPIALEASGGVNLTTVAAIAATGVDRISIGALTHSATAMDIALEFALSGS